MHPTTLDALWNAVAGDVSRAGRDQTAAAKLLEEVAVALGNPLKWEGAAKAMGMASGATAREYTELLGEAFTLLTVYFWDLSGRGFQPSRQRKVYFLDPLFAAVAPRLMPGARRPPAAALVENAVAVGLFRSAAATLTQAAPAPGAIGYWRSTNGRELDFVVPSRDRGRGGRLPVEVKGDADAGIGRARDAVRRSFGEGLVVSRRAFDPTGPVPVLPAHVLLAGLSETPRREAALG